MSFVSRLRCIEFRVVVRIRRRGLKWGDQVEHEVEGVDLRDGTDETGEIKVEFQVLVTFQVR